MSDLNIKEYGGFEEIKHTDEVGNEYWLARELAPILEYARWENFQRVLDRAMLACKNSGYNIKNEFRDLTKFIEHGKGVKRKVADYNLSRYACYLIVQNGDPRKEVIALGQTYFAIQTRRQEVADYFNLLDEENKRLVVRGNIKQWNQMLAESAHHAGVIDDGEYARFQNAGYMGLYGGETVEDIHKRKGLEPKEKILDFMNSSELAANLFRITLADEKLKTERVSDPEAATIAHSIVGQEVRGAIKRAGGILPEDQPTPEKSAEQIAKEQIKKMKARKSLMLDE
ncbi:MAG: DNA damage-inducible protein D [Clostridiales bacterium]|jgi:DNA-damage-inducible protein D|nr:DNA damage-inducible protein D [Clostridiales bacterium]